MNRKKKRQKSPGHTPLARHKKTGTRLDPRLADLPIAPIRWDRDLLPEHLWIASLRSVVPVKDIYKPYYKFMDAVDEFWPKDFPALGLMSDFSHLRAAKEEFIAKNDQLVRDLFLEPVGRILAFFPESPSSWLVTDGFLEEGGSLDPAKELGHLRALLVDLFDGRGELATAARLAVFGRLVNSGKVHFFRGLPVAELLPKYPDRCSAEERSMVESFVRASLGAGLLGQERLKEDWPKYFWTHNYDLAPCKPRTLNVGGGDPVTCEEVTWLETIIANNATKARTYLDQLAMRLRYDLYRPEDGEILHGLFARSVRLYLLVFENPSLWARDVAGIFIRSLVETAITLCYLAEKGTNEEFRKFREYGEAQKKLLMLHLQDSHPGSTSLEGRAASDLSDELGGFSAELIPIELGHWSKKDIRKLAKATGLEEYYRLVFSPTSADVHGTWASLKDSNLSVCAEPLHRFHRMPSYAEPPLYVNTLETAQSILLHAHAIAVRELNYPKDLNLEPLIRPRSSSDAANDSQ